MDLEQTRHYSFAGILNTKEAHLVVIVPGSTTLVGGNVYLCRRRSGLPRCLYADLLVSYNVDWENVMFTNRFVIEESGKPPDLMMEIASHRTWQRDCTEIREIYAKLDVPEYWRFLYSEGDYHDAILGWDILANGEYQPMQLTTEPDGVVWGYREILSLSVCRVAGTLRS